MLWRLARACHIQASGLESKNPRKKELILEGTRGTSRQDMSWADERRVTYIRINPDPRGAPSRMNSVTDEL